MRLSMYALILTLPSLMAFVYEDIVTEDGRLLGNGSPISAAMDNTE